MPAKLHGCYVAMSPTSMIYVGSHAQNAIKSLTPGEVILLENTRFYAEENMNRALRIMQRASHGEKAGDVI